jgi:hypothetical protein
VGGDSTNGVGAAGRSKERWEVDPEVPEANASSASELDGNGDAAAPSDGVVEDEDEEEDTLVARRSGVSAREGITTPFTVCV